MVVFLSGPYWVSAHQLIGFEASDTHIVHIWKLSLHRGDSRVTTHFQPEFNIFLAEGTVGSHNAVKQLPEKSGKWQQCDSTMSYTLELPTFIITAKILQLSATFDCHITHQLLHR